MPIAVLAVLAVLAAGSARAASELAVGQTRVNGSLFIDASHLDSEVDGVPSDASGTGVDLKRFYFNVEHRFSPAWSARLLTDIQWRRNQDPTDLWLKYAYLQGRFSKAFALRLGTTPMPWSALVNKWSGFRYIDPDLVSRDKVGETADWGVHALGALDAAGSIQYAVSVVTGAGYKQPRLGNGPDVAARIAWLPIENLVLAAGGYEGTRAKDTQSPALHTARRWSVMAAWAGERWRVGAQYFRSADWTQVMKPQSDHGYGWSAWTSVQLTPVVALFARRDWTRPSAELNPHTVDRYTNAGIEWHARPWLRLAAVWKHESLVNGSAHLLDDNEAGIWAQVDY